MNSRDQQQSHPEEAAASARVQRLGRRAFIVSAAAAVSGAAFWLLRKSTLVEPQPVDAASAPANVTIVEFAANGQKTGKVTVPRIVKTDAEWKQQLSPISLLQRIYFKTDCKYAIASCVVFPLIFEVPDKAKLTRSSVSGTAMPVLTSHRS